MPKSKSEISVAFRLAACAFDLNSADGAVQLLPAGEFRARDGRPAEVPAWKLTPERAAKIVALVAARKTRTVIDYEHQTLLARKNGQPAPAAGWFDQVEFRPGLGLFAASVDWTEKAAAHIAAGEYAYLSAVFPYDIKTGEVLDLYHAALTNTPALDGLAAVTLAAASQFATFNPPETPRMNELMERLCYITNLPLTTSPEEMAGHLDKLKGMLKSDPAQAAASLGLGDYIASLTAKTPDPARFVPVETVTALQTKVADLTARLDAKEVDDLVEAGLSDGRILPEMEEWARDLGNTNRAALSAYLEKATPIAALARTQTGGKLPAGGTPTDGKPIEERAREKWAASAALQAEFGGDLDAYISYCKAEQSGQIKVFGGKEQ
jgi:phage I-like protein